MIRLGNLTPKAFYLGSRPVCEIWKGQKRVWPDVPYDAQIEFVRVVEPTGVLLNTDFNINDNDWVIEWDGAWISTANWAGVFYSYTNETSESTRAITYQQSTTSLYAGYRRQANSQTKCDLADGNTITERNRIRLSYMKLEVYRYSTGATQTFNLPAPSGTVQPNQILRLSMARGRGRIYGFKIWHSGELMMDLMPVRTGAEPCFYDTVTQKVMRIEEGQRQYVLCGPDIVPVEKSIPSQVGGYVQDGLVAMWDAKENNGAGSNSNRTTTWKNLGSLGSTYDFTLDDQCYWTPNAMVVNSWKAHATSPMIPRDQIKTMEIVFRPRVSYNITGDNSRIRAFTFGDRLVQGQYNMTRRMLAWDVNSGKRGWMFGTGNALPSGQSGTSMPVGPDVKTFSVVYPTTNDTVYASGSTPVRVMRDGTQWNVSSWLVEGDTCQLVQTIGNPRSNAGNVINLQGIVMEVFCVRLYSRQLTVEEQNANHDLDVQRYG